MCSTLNFWPSSWHSSQRFVARFFEPLKRFVGFDDFRHLRFDRRKIVLGERTRQHHVVIKSAAHGRAKRQLHAVE